MVNKETGQTPKVPASRFNIDAHYHKNNDRPGSFGVLGGYFLSDDLAAFDPGLFGITPVEAMWMDPQQRKLLEVVYEALESGGISLESISGTRTAVFAASFTADWQQMAFKEPSFRHSLAATGVDPGIISNRISHVFNLNGPSIVCNTACSSSVYALHNACNALRNNEADGAIVGGVNLIITVDQHMNTAKLGVLSPTSTCHTFDASADGYGRADAVGAVYLKRLSDAIRDGDPIRGVIRSSATNSNGKVPAVGITHPNREGQADVISQAYKRGGDLDPRLTGYFECHGTGTAVGDPLEVHAVSLAMNKERNPTDEPLWIGAVKTNIGHSEAASGLSALIKAILIVERGVIPATRGVVRPSPSIRWKDWQVRVPMELVPFPSQLPVRRVSINSFGYGGTNAHVIVEGAGSLVDQSVQRNYTYIDDAVPKHGQGGRKKRPAPRRAASRKRPFLLPFSAHDKATLIRNIDAHGSVASKYDLLDFSHTLANRRSRLNSRAFAVASHSTIGDTFKEVLASFSFGEHKKKSPVIGFVFTGQGAQWPRMGAELLEYSSTFLASIRTLDNALDELIDGPEWSIEDILLEYDKTSPVGEAEFSQPLCTAVQIALVQLLAEWGIQPVVTVGHSSGEIAAAFSAGLISAEEAITVAYYRGQVTKDIKRNGAMLAVGLGAQAAQPYIAETNSSVVIACHNSPAGVTLSGDSDEVLVLKEKLDAAKVFARVVNTNGKAYHSHHMSSVAERYENLIHGARKELWHATTESKARNVKMVSSVTNEILSPTTQLGGAYWSNNLRSPVLFNQAVQTVLTSSEFDDVDLLVEIGPHSAMAGPIKQIRAELKADHLDYVPSLIRGKDSAAQLLTLAGELFLRGYSLDMNSVVTAYLDESENKVKGGVIRRGSTIVDLPPYQWNYTRPFWAEARASLEHRQPKYPRHDVLGQLVIGTSLQEPTWRNILRLRDLPWLRDHSLGGEAVFPAAGYFSMALEAITQLNELSNNPVAVESFTLRDVSIKKALVTPDDDDGIEVMTNFSRSLHGGDWWDFAVSSIRPQGIQVEHIAGSIKLNAHPRRSKAPRELPVFTQRATGKSWNDALREVGFDYGPTFQDMDDISFDGKRYEAICRTAIKQSVDASLGESRYVLHPATVDSVLQLSIAAIYAGRTNAMTCGVVPIQVDEVTIWPPSKEQLVSGAAKGYAWVPRRGVRSFEGSAQITADDGELILDLINIRTTSYEAAVPQKLETSVNDAAGPYGEIVWSLDFDTLETNVEQDLSIPDLVKLALFKYPNLKILELGTQNILQVLQKNPLAEYTATIDEDGTDSQVLKDSVAKYLKASIGTLIPELELESQSFQHGEYDLLITHVEVLSKVKNLVKKGGYIITVASTPLESDTSNGDISWFFAESSGVRIGRMDAVNPETNGSPLSLNTKHRVHLLYRKDRGILVDKIKTALESFDWIVTVGNLKVIPSVEHVIFLADFEGPLVLTLTEEEFLAIQTISNSVSAILWTTNGGFITGKRPEYALVQGLSRSLNSEQASLDFRVLDVDLDSVSEANVVQSVTRIAQQQFQRSSVNGDALYEREISVSGDRMYISRLERNRELNDFFIGADRPEPTAFSHDEHISGRLVGQGQVVFEQVPQHEGEETGVKPNHVEIRVTAAGLAREGVLVITGSDYPTTFSYIIGGTVTRTGSGVSNLKPGDMVVGFNPDKFANYQQAYAPLVFKVDGEYEIRAAVGEFLPHANALYGLETLASAQKGESVLILPGTGAAGVAAGRIARAKRAVPYFVSQNCEEATTLQNQLGISEKQVIVLGEESLSERLNELTNGHGVDIIISGGNGVQADLAREAWRSIARFGRFVDFGRKDLLNRRVIDNIPISRGASYQPFDLLDLYEARPNVLSTLLTNVASLFKAESTTSLGDISTVPLANLNDAVASYSDAFDKPVTVITYEESETPLHVIKSQRIKPTFSKSATYLLVGCLGGIGRSLTAWMMKLGARRFTFLSRSGSDSKSAARLIADIEADGAIVTVVRGDATSRSDVVRAVEAVPPQHPIRGVVHAAMVLRVSGEQSDLQLYGTEVLTLACYRMACLIP